MTLVLVTREQRPDIAESEELRRVVPRAAVPLAIDVEPDRGAWVEPADRVHHRLR